MSNKAKDAKTLGSLVKGRRGPGETRAAIEDLFENSELMHPAEFMALLMDGTPESMAKLRMDTPPTNRMRFEAARELLPYLAPKKKTIDMGAGEGTTVAFVISAPPGADTSKPPDLSKGAKKPKAKRATRKRVAS